MCVSDVGRVAAIAADGAAAELVEGGPRREVSLAVLVLEGTLVSVGDWVEVHTGLAVGVLDEADAVARLASLADAGALAAGPHPAER